MAMLIQQDEYCETYDVKRGPSNYTLVNFIFPGCRSVTFYTAGKNQKRFDIILISMKSIELSGESFCDIYERRGWEFEGFVSGKRAPYGKVKGTYNSHTRTGKLYVLAHEQPKPLVEVLSWEEVVERTQGKDVSIEFKHRKNGTLRRVKVLDVEVNENLLHVKRMDFSAPDFNWTGIDSGATSINIEECSPPLASSDGRIQFTSDGIDYTLYLPGSGTVFACL